MSGKPERTVSNLKKPSTLAKTSKEPTTPRTTTTTASNKIPVPRSTTIATKSNTTNTTTTTTRPIQRKASVPTFIATDKPVRKTSTADTNSAKSVNTTKSTKSATNASVGSAKPIDGVTSNDSAKSTDNATIVVENVSSSPLTDSSYELISPTSAVTLDNPTIQTTPVKSSTVDMIQSINTPPSAVSESNRGISNSILSPQLSTKSNALRQAQLNLSHMKLQQHTINISPTVHNDNMIELQKKYDQSVLELTGLKQTLQTQQIEFRDLHTVHTEKQTLQHTVESLQLDNELLTEQLDETKHTVEQHELTIQNQKLDIDVLTEQLHTAHEDLSQTLSTDQFDIVKTMEQNKQLVTALQQLKDITVSDKERYTSEITELTTENRRLHSIEIQYNALQTQLQTIQTQNNNLQIRLDELSSSEQMIEYLSNQTHTLHDTIHKYEADIGNLQVLLDACNDVEDQHNEYEQLLQQELEQKDMVITDLNNVIHVKDTELHTLHHTIQQFRQQVKQYENTTAVKLNFNDLQSSDETTQQNKQLQTQVHRLELLLQQYQQYAQQCNTHIYRTQSATQRYQYLLQYLPVDFTSNTVDTHIIQLFDCIDQLKLQYYTIYQYTATNGDTLQYTAVRLMLSLMSVNMLQLLDTFESYLYTATELSTVLQQIPSLSALAKSLKQLIDVLNKKQLYAATELYIDVSRTLIEFVDKHCVDNTIHVAVYDLLHDTTLSVANVHIDNDEIRQLLQRISFDTIHSYNNSMFNAMNIQVCKSVQPSFEYAQYDTTALKSICDRIQQIYHTNNNTTSISLSSLYHTIPTTVQWNTKAQQVRNTLTNSSQLTEQLQSLQYQLEQTTKQYTTLQSQYNELQLRYTVVNDKLKLLHSKQSIDYSVYTELEQIKNQLNDAQTRITTLTGENEHSIKENKALRKQLIKYKTQLTTDNIIQPLISPINSTSNNTATHTDTIENDLLRQTIHALRKQLQAIQAQQLVVSLNKLQPLPYIHDSTKLHKHTDKDDKIMKINSRVTDLQHALQQLKTGGTVATIDHNHHSTNIEHTMKLHEYNAIKLLHQVHVVKQQLNDTLTN